jgi:hypothetical protein
MTYTTGPWEAVPSIPNEGVECYWIRAAKDFGPITRGFRVVDIASVNGPQWKEQEATARLIAAAPELVEALRDAANRIDDMIECDAPGLAWSEARKSAARSRALLARIEGDEA